jgi:hypothetical protein
MHYFRTHALKALAGVPLALALGVAPAGACDPEDLKAEYRNLCATPTDLIMTLVEANAAKLKPEIRAELIAKAKETQALCLADKYDDAMRLAVRVAKALGAAEQEAGLPRERLTQVEGERTEVAAR